MTYYASPTRFDEAPGTRPRIDLPVKREWHEVVVEYAQITGEKISRQTAQYLANTGLRKLAMGLARDNEIMRYVSAASVAAAITLSAGGSVCEYLYREAQQQIEARVLIERAACEQPDSPSYYSPDTLPCRNEVTHEGHNDKDLAEIDYFFCLATACQADFTLNGEVDVDDLLFVINHWHEGNVDSNDLILVVNSWGACDR